MMKPSFIVLTGGPGAGKTAVLEMAKKRFLRETAFLPESASVIFSGGFWRLSSVTARMAAQRAIFHVQNEMENLVVDEGLWRLGICDRGTLDGLAFWPTSQDHFWKAINSNQAEEYKRYSCVIHMRTPSVSCGYNLDNKLRIETPEEAHQIDQRIEDVWSAHPNYLQVENFPNFIDKALAALDLIEKNFVFGAP